MTSFDIVIDPPAQRDLKKFKRNNPQLLSNLIKLIDSLSTNPHKGKP